jgi:hypothetical protein
MTILPLRLKLSSHLLLLFCLSLGIGAFTLSAGAGEITT